MKYVPQVFGLPQIWVIFLGILFVKFDKFGKTLNVNNRKSHERFWMFTKS